MIKFDCGNCGTKIKVQPAFAGKRVKCPGCGTPVRVPMPASASMPAAQESVGLDLGLLDALDDVESSVTAKKLRTLLLGCGACGKSIKVPENRMGSVFDCPKCKAKLNVPRIDLPPTSGSTVDLKHIELEPLTEPSLLNDTMSGTQLGATGVGGRNPSGSLMAGMTGSSMRTGSGTVSGATGVGASNSQEQMQQLRQLSDLKADSAISDEEFRRRKAEIYANASSGNLARKAMSRGPGGNEGLIRVERRGLAIPGFVKPLAVLAVVGGVGFAAWTYYLRDNWQSLLGMAPATSAEVPADGAEAAVVEDQSAPPTVVEDATPVESTPVEVAAPKGRAVVESPTVMVRPGGRLADFSTAPAGFTESDVVDTVSAEEAVNPIVVPGEVKITGKVGKVTVWPVMLPDVPGSTHPLAKLSSIVKQFPPSPRGTAEFGVGVGPEAEGLLDIEYIKFRDTLRQSLVRGGNALAGLTPRPNSDRAARALRGTNFQVWQASESRGGTAGRSLYVLTGVQNGFCVFYWFDGAGGLYNTFQKEVGSALIEPVEDESNADATES